MFNRKIIKHLSDWKDKKHRKPLILRGARQVGKTSAALMFAEKHFQNFLHLDLENTEHKSLFREDISLSDFRKIIEIKFKQELAGGKTLIFFDEIQNAPSLIKLLRFLYEGAPEIPVIAAGSLLEVMIEKEGFSFPVGRVELACMYPLDFFEFLEAKGEEKLLSVLRGMSLESSIPEGIHAEAMKHFYEYVMIGGMPEVVGRYLETRSVHSLKSIYASLMSGYCEDVYKYSSAALTKYLSFIIEQAPLFAGTSVTYEKFGGSRYRSREMSHAFSILQRAMLLYQLQATKSNELPLIEQSKRAKKLLFLDVGLTNYRMGVQEEFLNLRDLSDFYRGRIAEQVVGQNILSQFVEGSGQLLYWAREKSEGMAEIDFCLSHKGVIVGIEVKSGTANNLKSLFSFARQIKKHALVRVYGGCLKEEMIKIGHDGFNVVSIPFYLTPRILELIGT